MHRLLIANRGEIVSRVARSARARGISAVGVYSDPDATAPWLGDLDAAVRLPGTASTETYLDIAAVIAAARRLDADAIHPGYGFLSENPEFARAVAEAGLTFVGPPADVVRDMGSKVRAKQIAREAGLPVLPDAVLAADATDADISEEARRIGFPLLVKASAGGGGRGIRLVETPDALAPAVESARREAAAAFSDSTLFLEKFLTAPRHVEVQVVADRHGHVIHVGDRECSVQRRRQKLIEEAPASLIDTGLREAMAASSVTLAARIGYEGAGTCEYLVDGDAYYFLEMNTRLQVEHTVTEQISGLDLVDLQLRVAAGEELPLGQADVHLRGHAIQARVCAEDPAQGWIPQSGQVERYEHAPQEWLRYEDGIATGSQVSPHYDSMIVKLVASGPDRPSTVERLATGLRGTALVGPATNIDALVAILADEEYRRGDVTVNWYEGRSDLVGGDDAPTESLVALVVAAVRRARPFTPGVQPSWASTPRTPVELVVAGRAGHEHVVRYLPGPRDGVTYEHLSVDGRDLAVRDLTPSGAEDVRVEIDGVAYQARVVGAEAVDDDAGGVAHVWTANGQQRLTVAPRFADPRDAAAATGPVSPMPGTVLAVHVAEGQQVEEGDALAVVEAMKMEHVVRAGSAATVARVAVTVGQSVGTGELLVELEPA